jgi:hypothetical protein
MTICADAPVEQERKRNASPFRKTHHCIISATLHQMRHRQRLMDVETRKILEPSQQTRGAKRIIVVVHRTEALRQFQIIHTLVAPGAHLITESWRRCVGCNYQNAHFQCL